MDTPDLMRHQTIKPENIDGHKPCVGIVVPPSSFIVPPGWGFVLTQPFEGVSYIATVLHNAGYRVKIIDVRLAADPVEAALTQALAGVDVLGIATYEDGFDFIEALIARLKREHPEVPVILGGSLVTSVPEVIMKNTLADIAVLGEGELTILELMDLISQNALSRVDEIAGICYKDGSGNLIFTEKRPQMKDLNALPLMNLSLWPRVRENPQVKEILFSHSRGCYMNCSFCYRATPQLSLKSVEKFKQELQELKAKHDFEFIYFVDLTFVIDRQRALEICAVLKEFKVRWSCMCRVQNLDQEILIQMKQAGCQVILYGFESLDEAVLNKAHKGILPGEIKKIVDLTQSSGIQVAGLFILGLPGETPESLRKVIAFVKESGSACRVKYLSAIPGTEIYRTALEKGIIKNEVEHLRWLCKEKGEVGDEFLNFTALPDEALRAAFAEITSLYIKGPQYYQAWS
ncbi:MAG: radical SAM protein [Candidatus Omnitrophota bacterium]